MNILKRINKYVSKPLIVAFFILLLGGLITFYQNKLNVIDDVPDKTTVIVANRNIRKGEEIKGSHLKEKEIYITDEHPDTIKSAKDLVGKIALTNIIQDRQIVKDEIIEKKDWAKDEERDIGITFEHFTDLVGGSAIPGDILDIMVSFEGIEEIEEVIAIVETKDVYDDSNISYKETKDKFNFKPTTILVRVNEEQEKAIDIAKKQGRIYARRHGNYIRIPEEIIDDGDKKTIDEVVITGGE